MNEFSAVIGLTQLKKLEKLNKIRRTIAKKYEKEIDLENKMPYDNNCSYHLYWILVNNRKSNLITPSYHFSIDSFTLKTLQSFMKFIEIRSYKNRLSCHNS